VSSDNQSKKGWVMGVLGIRTVRSISFFLITMWQKAIHV